jgi:hypothetical protein
MKCTSYAPQVAAYVDSGEALAKIVLSILLCIFEARENFVE